MAREIIFLHRHQNMILFNLDPEQLNTTLLLKIRTKNKELNRVEVKKREVKNKLTQRKEQNPLQHLRLKINLS